MSNVSFNSGQNLQIRQELLLLLKDYKSERFKYLSCFCILMTGKYIVIALSALSLTGCSTQIEQPTSSKDNYIHPAKLVQARRDNAIYEAKQRLVSEAEAEF